VAWRISNTATTNHQLLGLIGVSINGIRIGMHTAKAAIAPIVLSMT